MQRRAVKLPDKTIVDRTRPGHNAELHRALSQTRQKLTDAASIDPTFDANMLLQHLKTLETSLFALPLLITATALGALAIGFGMEVLVWAFVSNLLYLALAFIARRSSRRDSQKRFDMRAWSIGLLIAHGVAGLTWAVWAFLPCEICNPQTNLLFKTMAMLIAMAATATICFSLRWATLAAFAIPVLTVVITKVTNGTTDANIVVGMMVLALVFFTWLASRLNLSAQDQARIQGRNDALIAELEVEKANSEAARIRAEDANLAKSRFLASMSHELRTPLNAILGFSEVMTNAVMGPIGNAQYEDYVRDIHQSGEHLLKLINEILDLSRVEAGKYDMQNESLRLGDIAMDCVALVRMRAEKKAIALNTSIEDSLPKLVGDERALRQIILNLLSNAVKFTPQNGSIDVTVGWTATGGQYVSVKDTGPGIPKDEIPIVLSAFGQGAIAIKNAEQGTGLGLPIVQALVQLHDGRFKLESELRKGTRATAFFPAQRSLEAIPKLDDDSSVNGKKLTSSIKAKKRTNSPAL